MDLIQIYYIIFIVVVKVIDIRCKTTMGCNVTRGSLTCSDNNLIHVESVSFWLYSGDDCNDETRISCGTNITNGDNGLTPGCNGQTSCIETIHTPSDCNGTTSTVFNYRCVDRDTSLIDMCDSIDRDGGNRVFLTSPGYPSLSHNSQGECRCSIMGTNITSITILDLRLVSAMDGTMSSLYIQYGDKSENITSRINTSKTLYNYKLQLPSTTTATTADVMFNHNQINGQKLWMEIKGIAFHVSCNQVTTSSSPSIQSTVLSSTTRREASYTSTTLQSSIAVKTTTTLPIPSTSTVYSSTKPTSTPQSLHTQTITSTTPTTLSTKSSSVTEYTSSVSTSSNTTTDVAEKSVSNVEPGISPLLVGIIGLSVSNILTLSCFIAFCVYRRRKPTLSESSTLQMRSITQGVAGTDETPSQRTLSPNNPSSNYVNQPSRQTVTNEYEPLGRRLPTQYEDVAGTDETPDQQTISPNNSRSSNYVNQPSRQTISPNNPSSIYVNQPSLQTVTNEYEPLGRRIPTHYEALGGRAETVDQQTISPNNSSSNYVNQPTRQTTNPNEL